jgi:lipopolysaccharide export system permease protein
MSPVINRYLRRELLQYWIVITLVLWLVLVAARFSAYLGQAASGQLPADIVLLLLALKSVGFFVFLMPLTMFLALLWVLGRLNRDYESLALAASGVGPRQLYRAITIPTLGIALLVGFMSWYLVPLTAQYGYQLRAQAEQDVDIGSLTPGRFHELRNGRWLVFAQRTGREPQTLESVFVHIQQRSNPQVLVADSARLRENADSGHRALVLQNGYRYDGRPGDADYRVLHYRQYVLSLQPRAAVTKKHWDAVRTKDLWNDPGPQAVAELQMRVSRPLSVVVLALLAVPLARFRPGVSEFYPLWLGVLVFTLYFNLLGTGQLWLEQERMPAWAGLWWTHLLFLGAAGAWVSMQRLRTLVAG